MCTDLEIVETIAEQLAEKITTRAWLASNTDFNNAEQVEKLQQWSDEINELFDRQEHYLGKIMAKQIKRAA